MDSITIRNLAPGLKARLRLRAAAHGLSMEAEARQILQAALAAPPDTGRALVERIRTRFAPFGGVTLELPPREPAREPPPFD